MVARARSLFRNGIGGGGGGDRRFQNEQSEQMPSFRDYFCKLKKVFR